MARLSDGAHLAELVGEHLAGVIVGGIDAVASGFGGGDEGHETHPWDVAHPMDGAGYLSLSGDGEHRREDEGRKHRCKESLHRGPLSDGDQPYVQLAEAVKAGPPAGVS